MEEEIKVSKNLLKTMTSDTRADILKLLGQRPMTSSELSRALNKHVTTVSEHLGNLKNSNMVERVERPGHKWIYYKLTKDANKILHPQSYYKWVIVLSFAFIVFVGTFISSSNAIPGDPLYGLKRFSEDVRLSLANTESDKASLHVEMAQNRLEEAKFIAEKNDTSGMKKIAEDYTASIENANKELQKAEIGGKDTEHILEKINEDTAKHISILENIEEKNPNAKEYFDQALNYSQHLHNQTKTKLEIEHTQK